MSGGTWLSQSMSKRSSLRGSGIGSSHVHWSGETAPVKTSSETGNGKAHATPLYDGLARLARTSDTEQNGRHKRTERPESQARRRAATSTLEGQMGNLLRLTPPPEEAMSSRKVTHWIGDWPNYQNLTKSDQVCALPWRHSRKSGIRPFSGCGTKKHPDL